MTTPDQIPAFAAARQLGISRQRVYQLCAAGKLTSTTDAAGTRWVTVASIEAWRVSAARVRYVAAGAPGHEGEL